MDDELIPNAIAFRYDGDAGELCEDQYHLDLKTGKKTLIKVVKRAKIEKERIDDPSDLVTLDYYDEIYNF